MRREWYINVLRGMEMLKGKSVVWALYVSCIVGFWGAICASEVLHHEPQAPVVDQEQHSSVCIRPFVMGDYDAVIAIAEESKYWLNGSGVVAELLRAQHCQAYVCIVDDVIAGFIIFDITVTNEFTNDQVVGGIRYMAVKRCFQSSGCGRLLAENAVQILEDQHAEAICLSVKSDNERAIRFYQSLGFGFMVSEDDGQQQIKMCRLGKNAMQFVALNRIFDELMPTFAQ
jgi:ribosomal protein S18 acetylase RimI-like enzyme